MRVLILSMTVGQGHNSTSKALRTSLEANGHDCEILDTYKFLNKAIGLGFDKGYTAMGRFIPKLNENIYKGAERANGRGDMKMYFPWAFAKLTKNKMQRYIEETKPDVIVCSIVMTAILITALKEAGMLDEKIKSIGIVTDFSLHPFWEYTAMDYFVAANELLIPEFTTHGIAENKILPTGIPIAPKFAQKLSKMQAREKLGLDTDAFTVLIASGGMGFAGLVPVLQDMDTVENIHIAAVCGSNVRLKNKLNSMTFQNPVKVLGFVDNMDEYIDASDVVVTKPGGLSTSEAIAKQKPLILMKPMPGVENMNLAFLLNNSLAIHANDYQTVSQVIRQMRMNDLKMDEMKKAQEKWGKKNSAAVLAEFIEKLN
ncbi:MAG: glycosyltransferase [Christensenella sp.]|nr:glycosyltransferase [Christensenella sp.]